MKIIKENEIINYFCQRAFHCDLDEFLLVMYANWFNNIRSIKKYLVLHSKKDHEIKNFLECFNSYFANYEK